MKVTCRVAVGAFSLEVDFVAEPGAVTAVLGPNGAGKTTLLRCVSHAQSNVGLVPQGLLLFPHLSARDNVAFGPRARGASKAAAAALATELLARFGIAARAEAKPRALSGGEAQRVALARALAIDPAALLLDEPLAALDAGTRVEVRRELRRHLVAFGRPVLLVTHDPVDVLALADQVVVLEAGRVTQQGALADVMARPQTPYVASLLGTNLVCGVAAGTTITGADGATVHIAEPLTGEAFATIAPSAVALHQAPPSGSPRNQWRTEIRAVDLLGSRVRVQLGEPWNLIAEVTPAALGELGVREGDAVWASVKATEVVAYARG